MRALALILLLMPAVAAAQDDRSYLTALLEDNLSGAGRRVVVTGFVGALSSQATVEELTIADDQGVWLTLRDISLDWNRSALFSGQVSVNALRAGEIVLERMPVAEAGLPSAEASSFALPELPVSVEIGALVAEKISLGAAVLGTAVEGRLEASMSLIGGEGRADLVLERRDDGPGGRLALAASYANAGQRLVIDLEAREAAGGIAAGLLGLPGAPSVELAVQGDGPLADFVAEVGLQTDGISRLAGEVRLTGNDAGEQGFSADLSGDLAPLFLPDYAAFFGQQVVLRAEGQRFADGRMALSDLEVTAGALDLRGAVALAADGLPERIAVTGRIGLPEGPVLLPLSTEVETRIGSADIFINYDAQVDENWRLQASILGLERQDFTSERLELEGSGRIGRAASAKGFDMAMTFAADGLAPADPAMAAALGSSLTGKASAIWSEGDGAVTVSQLALNGADYGVEAAGRIAGLEDTLTLTGTLTARVGDAARFSGLAGRPLGGATRVEVQGNGSPLSGAFDLAGRAEGRDMRAGIAELDNLLRGEAAIGFSVLRNTTGTELRHLTITAATLDIAAKGQIASTGSALEAQLRFDDLGVLGAGYRGALTGKASFTGSPASGRVRLDATGRGLGLGVAEVDKLLQGDSAVSANLVLREGVVQIEAAELRNPQLAARATGTLEGTSQSVEISAELSNLGLLLPEFPGALQLQGRAVQDASGTTLDLAGSGPGRISATVKGKIAPGYGRADLAIKGTGQAALANSFITPRAITGSLGFDLRLNGPFQTGALAGSVTLSQGRLADPSQNFALQAIAARAELAGGRANVTAQAAVSTGGGITAAGSIGLTAPYPADLAVDIQRVTLRDPDLYETTANGALTLTGPLTGGALIAGRLALSETELRVPSTGFASAGDLPGLQHRNEAAAQRATRARAGQLETTSGQSTTQAPFRLDVIISAPNRVFLRGRGLDAELGGELLLRGTTASVQPGGALSLIRGRLDILGKRLDLDEAVLQMEGELVPFLRIVASTENDGITSSVVIEGPADDPVVSFESAPELPQEEVLAQLLFGQTLQNLSALQAVQLAGAVRTLAGKGGDGLVSKLRRGIGLDNLDVKTASDGTSSVTAGKYLTEKIYSEVSVDQNGKSQINLNLDLRKHITLRGRASSDGTTGFGILLEKDY